MNLKKTNIALTLALTLLLFFPDQIQAALYDKVQESLICPACLEDRMTIATCTDSTAEQARQDIRQKLALGQTKEDIIQGYVAQYGEIILSIPPQKGFGLVAWIVPPLALVGAGIFVIAILKAWVRNSANQYEHSPKKRLSIDSIDEERINEEIKKYL